MNRSPAACTIIARNYLSHARILAESFLRHEPGGRFYTLVVDGLPQGVDAGAGVRVISPDDLNLPHFFEMCFKYDPTELCTAVKPALLSLLLDRYQEETVIYFDPDILITRPLGELKQALTTANLVLIPHLLDPIPLDGLRPSEQDILAAGAYNLGFIAIKKSTDVAKFLAWWDERLRDGCRIDVANGLFVDQKWVDLIPGYFPSVHVLRDETYDVAYWNLHSRPIERSGDQFLVHGRPLAFFHFSGFNPTRRKTLSKHQNRIKVVDGTPLADLLKLYADLQMQHGYATCSRWPYGYTSFDSGIGVNSVIRSLYLSLDEQTRNAFGNPFRSEGPNSFLAWATCPRSSDADLSPFLLRLYQSRPDIMAAFPNVRGKDRERFLRWARTLGARELGYDPEFARVDKVISHVVRRNGGTTAGADSSTAHDAALTVPSHGVNVCGYLRNETGIGAAARGYVGALRSLGVPLALWDISELSPNRSEDPTLVSFDNRHPYEINLVCVNADQHFVVKSHVGERFFDGRYNIGVWFWELPTFPPEWRDRFADYDEIWTATSHIANAIGPVSPIPVVRIPPVVNTQVGGSRERGRNRLKVGAQEFVYLFIFDFRSYFERKNPLALIDAFKRAFSPKDPVRLVIKCVNEDVEPHTFATMQARAQGYPISIHTGYWSLDEMRDLMAAADTYASLHRSEGLGLTIADAMAFGKPVIATAWSGNADFMHVSNSFPVRYDLVKIERDIGPYKAGQIWADPSVEHAAELMRFVFENRDEAAARGQAGKREIETNYSEEKVAGLIPARLEAIARTRTSRTGRSVSGHPGLPGQEHGETRSALVGAARSQLHQRAPAVPPMSLNSSLYGRIGRLMKSAVAFLLSYHTYYQQTINQSFSRFMRELALNQDSLAEELDDLAGRVHTLERLLEELRESAHTQWLPKDEDVVCSGEKRPNTLGEPLDQRPAGDKQKVQPPDA